MDWRTYRERNTVERLVSPLKGHRLALEQPVAVLGEHRGMIAVMPWPRRKSGPEW